MNTINPAMKIGELLAQYPETAAVFRANGFPADNSQQLLELLGPQVMLKTVLQVKGMNEELFIRLLEENIAAGAVLCTLQDEGPVSGRADFLGYTYCPIKHIFKEHFDHVLQQYLAESKDADFQYYVPSGCSGEEDPYEEIWKTDNIEDFPDVVVAGGYGDFFRQEFVERFVKKGYFQSVRYETVQKNYVSANYQDPAGWYTAYSALPIVMLVDRKKLGSLPVPACWDDLLNPIYANNVIIGASQDGFYEDILLYTYKEHGEKGLRELAVNVKGGMHGAQMAKLAGSSSSQGAAIYVIPWLFAQACPRTDSTLVVWPEDGALITPMYLLVKKQPKKNLQTFIDFVMGSDYGQKSADNYFPVLHPAVDNKLPPEASFKWLGWEYVHAHSMEQLTEQVVGIFNQAWERAQQA